MTLNETNYMGSNVDCENYTYPEIDKQPDMAIG